MDGDKSSIHNNTILINYFASILVNYKGLVTEISNLLKTLASVH